MNIAICISGEPRMFTHFQESANAFKKQCEDNNINLHIFYHLWDHVTRRQRNYKSQDPIIENVKEEDVISNIPVTAGVFESKDSLNDDIDYIWNHICNLPGRPGRKSTSKHARAPRYDKKEILQNQIWYTNTPGYSQMASLCKSNLIRIEYEKANNIQYDLIIRTRTDVEFKCNSIPYLVKLINDSNHFSKKIFFPLIEVWNTRSELQIIPEFCFFLSNSTVLNENIFNDYCKKITSDMFSYDSASNDRLRILNDHTVFVNLILNNIKIKLQSNLEAKGFKYKIHQLPVEYNNEKVEKYSNY
tara:strand:- start:3073 stop:3978 length:906 start_codon:yes stop_codon:yes gene_type:complete